MRPHLRKFKKKINSIIQPSISQTKTLTNTQEKKKKKRKKMDMKGKVKGW
jgi:hypothetical protein